MPELSTTIGQLLVNSALPEDFRDYNRVLDSRGITKLLQQVAERHPDEYRRIVQHLLSTGKDASFTAGQISYGLRSLRTANAAKIAKLRLRQGIQRILNNPKLTDERKGEEIVKLVQAAAQPLEEEILRESTAEGNPLAHLVQSGARGNPLNLKSLRGADLLYTDHHDRVIPIPVLHSYSEGLTPAEYWAGTYGARRGVMATKFCLAGGTEVLMADYTRKPIEQVRVGDWVMTLNSKEQLVPTRTTAVFDNGLRDCHTYYFRDGRSRQFIKLTATPDHVIRVKYRNKRGDIVTKAVKLSEIHQGRKAALVHSGSSPGLGIREPRAALLGALLGDGGISGHNTNFYCADTKSLASMTAVAAANGLTIGDPVHANPASKARRYGLSPTIPERGIGNGRKTEFRAWLQSLGVLGLRAPEKFIPSQVWSWNTESCGQLLSWLFETDGCVTWSSNGKQRYPVISFAVTSKRLAEDTRRLLQDKFGVFPGPIRRQNQSGRRYRFRQLDGSYRTGISKHDLYSFLISRLDQVCKVAEFWRDTGTKSDLLHQALSTHHACYANSFERRFVRADYAGKLPTYDIEVEHPSHFFVLGSGLVVSNSVRDAGAFSKQLNQLAHRLIINRLDADDDDDAPRGLPVEVSDPDNEGALLAIPAGPYPRNTILTPKILKDLESRGIEHILVRSPAVRGTPEGGLYARDVGVRERGGIAPLGDNVGLAAAQAVSEPLSQSQLSAKHSGGVAGKERALSGFQYLNQLVQVPKQFKGGAAHAQIDGTVQEVRPAPAGGSYVVINGEPHFVGAGYVIKVKPGDKVEAGDILSDGIPNPAEIVRHKGIGEGRRYFVKEFRDAYAEIGLPAHRRNVEIIAHGLINHVRLNDELGNNVPDDVVPYSMIERMYKPREGARLASARQALNKYIEKPVLHYSIGTRIRPSMLPELERFGIKQVMVHDDPPPFEPEMIRGMENLVHDPDWLVRMLDSHLKRSLLTAAHRGSVSDEGGTSFVPSLARAVDFGRTGLVRGWKPKDVIKPDGLGKGSVL